MRVVVVGAGLIGVSSAYCLARDGHEVTVLDREKDVALGTSYANGASLTPSMADPWNAPGVAGRLWHYLGKEDSPLLLRPQALPSLFFWGIKFLRNSDPARFERATAANARIASYSVAMLKTLEATLSLRYDQGPGGTLKLSRDSAGFDAMVASAATMQEAGVPIDILDAAGAVAREPALAAIQHEISGALYIASDEAGDARKYTLALADISKTLGVRFEYGATVTGFDRQGGRVNKVVAMQSGNHRYYNADVVVIAAGCWSPAVTAGLGIRLPIKPVKGYSITTPRHGWCNGPRIPVVDEGFHAIVTPLGDRLRVAGTAEFAGFDNTLTPSRIANLTRFLTSLYPDFNGHFDSTDISPWCGFRPMSADGVPFIGQSRIENVYLNTGHGHLGWTMASGSGRLLADLVLSKVPAIDPAPYDPARA
ncbi:D-amino acid dehydrogenase [Govanella unica]|uniref:D-amino acid dehydrogenase n=1 Tax=Govanella unica TaxID=2975056 RepID=A0A9X3Z7N3_9PROT|nr:D-amino acid dehydrogenase [Govania unica]MDA5194238.1 D-amino acid dehydrogenase [Govania unica]